MMRATYNTLSTNIKNLETNEYLLENEPSKFSYLTKKELTKRLERIQKFKDTSDPAIKGYETF